MSWQSSFQAPLDLHDESLGGFSLWVLASFESVNRAQVVQANEYTLVVAKNSIVSKQDVLHTQRADISNAPQQSSIDALLEVSVSSLKKPFSNQSMISLHSFSCCTAQQWLAVDVIDDVTV